MICYAKFEVSLHGLKIETQAELDGLTKLLKTVIESYHPESLAMMDGDVEVELVESAGTIES